MNDPLEREMVRMHKPPHRNELVMTRIHSREDSEVDLAEVALVDLAARQGEEVDLQGEEKEDSTNPQGRWERTLAG